MWILKESLATLFFLIFLLASSNCLFARDLKSNAIWFDQIDSKKSIKFEELEDITKGVYQAVVSNSKFFATSLPEKLLTDRDNRIFFLSLSDGQSVASTYIGTGVGALEALNNAIRKIPKSYQRDKLQVVQVDSVARVQKVDPNKILGQQFVPKLTGFALGVESRAWQHAQDYRLLNFMSSNLKNRQNVLCRFIKKSAQIALKVRSTCQLYSFSTNSYFASSNAAHGPLYRGHTIKNSLHPENLFKSSKLAGHYLGRMLGSDGRFIYNYNAYDGSSDDEYNILRHAGTIYSLLELYQATKDSSFLDSARKAFLHLDRSVQECPKESDSVSDARATACLIEAGAVKLGGNALALLSYVTYQKVTGDDKYLETAKKLAAWIAQYQSPDGRFTIHKQFVSSGKITDFVSNYYPGESIYALAMLYSLDRDELWLTTADRAAQFLINIRDNNKTEKQLEHDHWLLYGLNELHQIEPKKIYLEHTKKLTSAIVNAQNIKPHLLDWFGSYHTPPRSTPTATRSEGLSAAYQILVRSGLEKKAKRVLLSIQRGVTFQLQTQVLPETSIFLQKPARAIGGFTKSLTSPEIRIDYVQHNISSMLSLRGILENY